MIHMGILDFFRKRPDDQEVVFAGDRIEAGLILNMLKEEGFNAYDWADLPGPLTGSAGMSRIVVPPEEGEAAKKFLASLKQEEEMREE
jgi:hypothetical protein